MASARAGVNPAPLSERATAGPSRHAPPTIAENAGHRRARRLRGRDPPRRDSRPPPRAIVPRKTEESSTVDKLAAPPGWWRYDAGVGAVDGGCGGRGRQASTHAGPQSVANCLRHRFEGFRSTSANLPRSSDPLSPRRNPQWSPRVRERGSQGKDYNTLDVSCGKWICPAAGWRPGTRHRRYQRHLASSSPPLQVVDGRSRSANPGGPEQLVVG